MRRKVLTLLALLMLSAVGFAQLQDILPVTVQLFLEERATMRQIKSHQGNDAPAYVSSRFAPTRMINGQEMADVFIDFEHPGVISLIKSQGVIVNCVFDDFLTAQVPVDKLRTISRIKGVINVEVSGMAELCTDSTLSVTHAKQVLDGLNYGLPKAFDGTGVIIGMIDTGYDYQHTAFRKSNDPSKTRIVRVYDPQNTTGHPVIIGDGTLPGSVFMNEQIDTLTTDAKKETHGTHTTGIAAGRNVNGYGGMAPGADIVMCSSRTLNSGISEAEVVNCIKYIYSYADSVGKPCVISVSMSNRFGAHDGDDKISRAVAQCVGPGRIFVVSAGNTGSENTYCHGPVLADKPLNMLIGHFTLDADESYNYANTWLTAMFRDINVRPIVQFHILDKQTSHIVWESDLIKSQQRFYTYSDLYDYFTSSNGLGYFSCVITLNPVNLKFEAACEFKDLKCKSYYYNSDGKIMSRYQIGISIYPPSVISPRQPDSCYVDSWICTANGRRTSYTAPVYRDIVTEDGDTVTQQYNNFYRPSSNYCSIGTYAIHDSIISAGGFEGRRDYYSMTYDTTNVSVFLFEGRYMSLSSYEYPGYGPTGKALPTVMAPGRYVVSAANHYVPYIESNGSTVMKVGRDYWNYMSGTSMAAPTVAGIIAQWLQINPNLSPSQVKEVIAQTAIKDVFTRDPVTWYRYGPNGKIDALAGARYLLGIDENFIWGDVNGDGILNLTDLTWLIDYLLEDMPEGFVVKAANVYYDDYINLRDLTDLIDKLLEMED